MHMQAALAAAAAGCHLFIEKPLSHQEEGIEELIRLVDQRGLIALVGYQLRFHPFVKRLQELLASQAIGRILAARVEVGEYLPAWHKYEDYRKMYASRADLGGGVILSQIHEFDYLYSFFGMPRRIFALGGHLSSLEIDVEDIASILLEFRADGYRFPVHLHQDYVQRPPSRGCQLVGDAGRILVDFSALRLQLFDREGSVIEDHALENFQRNQLFLEEVAHFLECIEKGTSPIVTLRDGANSLRMALAAKASLQTGEVVYL
jgi:predicted dehydrogenase